LEERALLRAILNAAGDGEINIGTIFRDFEVEHYRHPKKPDLRVV
jgi:hypothetical protein